MFSSNIHVDEIRKRIEEFRRRADGGIPDNECVNQVTSIFGDSYSFHTETRCYSTGTKFFRARSIPDDDTIFPLRTIKQISDAWEPPSGLVKSLGRLNSIGQSVLYCCPGDPDLAIDEARARGNNHVAVMVYRSIKPVTCAVLGDYGNSKLPKDDISRLFYSFLDEEFAREVPAGYEGRYSITRAVADSFFNYPEQDAWCYRSVQSSSRFNTAFLPGRSRQCLELSGVMLCDLRRSSPGELSVKMVVDFEELTGVARYHHVGSEEQKRIFPDIE
jgi:hypothetical protein